MIINVIDFTLNVRLIPN